ADELHRHDLHVPIDAGHTLAVVAGGAKDARDIGAVAVVVQGVIGAADKVPAEQVVAVSGVAVLGAAVHPTALAGGAVQVAGVDTAIAVVVPDEAFIHRVVEVAEGDDAGRRCLDLRLVDQLVVVPVAGLSIPRVGDLDLVDPNILVQIRAVIVDTRIHDSDDDAGTAAGDIPGLLGLHIVHGPLLP